MTIPFSEGLLDVGAGHHLYFAEFGCPDAPAAVVLHGGPGSSCNLSMLEWFDLSRQRVVLFDQRGSGSSTPRGSLVHNTTQDLIEDIERLRQSLLIPHWLVVGGSWGAMLALAYAGAYPASVNSMVLRGVFLPGAQQMDWFFQSLQALVPAAWAELTTGTTRAERQSVLSFLTSRLLHGSLEKQHDAASRWGQYEDAVMHAMMGSTRGASTGQRHGQLEKYRLQSHYLSQGCFISERQIFRGARRIIMPTIVVHGTHDWICPPQNLHRLIRFMPQAQVRWVAQGTHTTSDTRIRDALRAAITDIGQETRTVRG